MNKNLIKIFAVAVVFAMPIMVFAETSPSPAPANTPTASVSPASIPPTSSSGSTGSISASVSFESVSFISTSNSGSSASAPATSGSGSSASVVPPTSGSSSTATVPPTGSSGSTATPPTGSSGSTATPPTSGSSSTASPVTPPTPPTPPSSGGSSENTRTSSSGSYVGFGYSGYIPSCPLITSYMKYGANNDANQVIKLQNFLKNVEKLDVDVNGIFDRKTERAVIAFQNKYSAVTMGPWGSTQGTGFVYITTLKKINQIACNQPLTLNSSELATINAYKNRRNAVVTVTTKPTNNTTEKVPVIEIEANDNNEDIVLTSEINEQNTAAVGKTSVMNKFWNFMIYLFK